MSQWSLFVRPAYGLALLLLGCAQGPNGALGKGAGDGGLPAVYPTADAGLADAGPAGPSGTTAAPGACVPGEEICDGADNDCDGEVDEIGCACVGEPACFEGPPALRGVGQCRDGVRACDQFGEQWLACTGSVLPSAEVCDGVDNNCDGVVDEGCCDGAPCAPEPDAGVPEPALPPECQAGAVTGLVCAPDGSPVAGAVVSVDAVDCAGQPQHVEARTAGDGTYRLDGVPAGAATVVVRAGRFQQRLPVNVPADGVADTRQGGARACLTRDSAAIAVTTGDYDSIEEIVQRLGFGADVYCGAEDETYGARALFGDWARLSRYDIVFVNCGLAVDFQSGDGPQMVANLRRFVAQGGALYVSDLAAHLITAAWPQELRFNAEPDGGDASDVCCTCVNCPAECGASADANGGDGQCKGRSESEWGCEPSGVLIGDGLPGDVSATVRDPILAQALGRDRMDIDFDAPDWISIGGTAADVQTYVEADGQPLMVGFSAGGPGRVTYTSFHNESQASSDVEAILRALVFRL